MFDCFEASSQGGTWVEEEIEWEDIFPYVHASSSLRVPPGTEEDVNKAWCIPLAMYSLADDVDSRDIAFKLSFMMIVMIYCPVYSMRLTVLAALSPQPRLSRAESIVFSVVSGGSCGGTAMSIQVYR